MSHQTEEPYDAQMWTYRQHLRSLNRRLAEEYALQNGHLMVSAIEALAQAAPVTLAIAQLHDAIRRSSAKNFWPIIRKTKGVLFVRSSDAGQDCPSPWRRTHSGNMRYELPGHLLFSPWPPNVRRRVRNRTIQLQQVIHNLTMPNTSDFLFGIFAGSIRRTTWQAARLVEEIKALQGIAMPDSIAALDRWSDASSSGWNITLRISRGVLVYRNGADRCEIEIPAALSSPLRVPSGPGISLEKHCVRAGGRSYDP